nr:hypothetical protein [Tanacetum cinerariifolium]
SWWCGDRTRGGNKGIEDIVVRLGNKGKVYWVVRLADKGDTRWGEGWHMVVDGVG